MTEAAIKRAKKQKLNKIILIASAIILVVLVVLWCMQYNITNSRAIPQLVEYYEPGEFVDIGDNFYVDAKEQLDGYSIRVNGAKLYDYEQFLIDNGCEDYLNQQKENNEKYFKYIVLLDLDIKNVENTEGVIMALKFGLYNESLNIPADFMIWSKIDEFFDGYPYLKVATNSEANLLIPFSPMPLNVNAASDDIERRLLEEDFYFCICEFPVRKMIRVPIENCINK